MGMYSREVINELNALSKEIFGSTSKWKKMIELGVPELIQEDTKKLTVVDGKQETETVKTPKMHVGLNGGELHQHTLRRYTVDEVREFMLTVKDRQEQVRQMIKRIEAQNKAQEEAKRTVDKAAGSSIK